MCSTAPEARPAHEPPGARTPPGSKNPLTAAGRPGRLAGHDGLFDLYDRLLGEVHIPGVFNELASVACEEFHSERASVFLIDKRTRELESVAVVGNVARTIRVPIRETSLAGYCAATGRAFVVPDAYGDLSGIDPKLRFDSSWDELNRFRTRDVMCAPAVFKAEIVGVVQIINSTGPPFCETDLPALRAVSRLIGYSLYHARLYDDLTTLKELEKQKAQFMRILIHELKSPVAAAKTMADSLQYHDAVANSAAAAVTAKISNRMGQLIELIKDLLHLAKVKSGDPLGEISVIDLTSATRSGCEQYREPAGQKGLDLRIQLPAGPVHTRFDSQGYQLVLSNLLSNAVKYTPTGSVEVVLRAAAPWAILDVTDSGIGIPKADVPMLFGEFFRASNARRAHIEGTGVGLAGAKGLVERFGGEFSLATRENEGSTFTVRLPLHAEQAEP